MPLHLQKCTLITVKATAGLRMLQGNLSNEIIEQVENKILQYPFPMLDKSSVSVMDGEQEGVLAWITLNYLLKKIGTDDRVPTAGIMDLGKIPINKVVDQHRLFSNHMVKFITKSWWS